MANLVVMKLICPKCGATNDEISFSGPFCVKCKPVNISCPKRMEFMRCSKCKKTRMKGNWINADEAKVSEAVISKCKGEFVRGSYSMHEQEATFFVGDKERLFPVKIPINVRIVRNICPHCSRQSGGYFEAIIQLRGPISKINRHDRMFRKILLKKTFVTKEVERKEGLDLYIGNSKAVVEMLSELGIKAKISKTLAGEKEGQRVYRTTFLVRL